MRTEKQIEASRRNGAKSKGPVTPEGKANSSQNAASHYLCAGPVALLNNEDSDEFNMLLDEFFHRFDPIDSIEADLVHKLVAATWRERRATAMETALLELEMLRQRDDVDRKYTEISCEARQVLALLGNHDDIRSTAALLFRYGATARRAYTAALRCLRELQGDRFNRKPAAAPVGNSPADAQNRSAAPGKDNADIHAIARTSAVVILRDPAPAPTPANTELRNEPGNAPKIAAAAGRGDALTLLLAS